MLTDVIWGERDRKKSRFLAYLTVRMGLLFGEMGKLSKTKALGRKMRGKGHIYCKSSSSD